MYEELKKRILSSLDFLEDSEDDNINLVKSKFIIKDISDYTDYSFIIDRIEINIIKDIKKMIYDNCEGYSTIDKIEEYFIKTQTKYENFFSSPELTSTITDFFYGVGFNFATYRTNSLSGVVHMGNIFDKRLYVDYYSDDANHIILFNDIPVKFGDFKTIIGRDGVYCEYEFGIKPQKTFLVLNKKSKYLPKVRNQKINDLIGDV
jgi:hypothetical protein